jgi:hypothetical protein
MAPGAGRNATWPPDLMLGITVDLIVIVAAYGRSIAAGRAGGCLVSPPLALICDPDSCDQRWATFWFWSRCWTPGLRQIGMTAPGSDSVPILLGPSYVFQHIQRGEGRAVEPQAERTYTKSRRQEL